MKSKVKAVILEYVKSFVVAIILALLIREFIVQAFKIPSGSMRPTLIEGDRILVNKFIYRFKEPERGDLIVFRFSNNVKKDFIKRVIARGGESVKIAEGNILINGKIIADPPFKERYYYNRGSYGEQGQTINVPEGHFYVLGDNSGSSRDSRYWGFVPRNNLIGKAFVIYWPPKRIGVIK